MYKHPLLNRDKMTPREALDILVEGNHRFTENIASNKDLQQLVHLTKDKQHPFAAVLSCSDSRAPVEMLFDQALGDIFSVRLAGNIASDKAIGSLEFSTKYLGSKIIVVLGHSSCGAVKAACDHFVEGNISHVINMITPALDLEKSESDQRNSENKDFVSKVAKLNVEMQMNSILRDSEILQSMIAEHEVGLIGGMYDLSSGKVEFYKDTAHL
jgi:carbonic anhydrase